MDDLSAEIGARYQRNLEQPEQSTVNNLLNQKIIEEMANRHFDKDSDSLSRDFE